MSSNWFERIKSCYCFQYLFFIFAVWHHHVNSWVQIYQCNEWHWFLLSIMSSCEELWKIYYCESLWIRDCQCSFHKLSEIFFICAVHDEYDSSISQILCVLLYWWHCYFFENLTESSSAFEHDVQFIWQAENNAQRNQNSFKVFINYSTRSMNWWFWHDFFEEENCSFVKSIFSENSEKSWNLFKSDWLTLIIYFLLCSTNWITAEQKDSFIMWKFYNWSSKKELFKENIDFWD